MWLMLFQHMVMVGHDAAMRGIAILDARRSELANLHFLLGPQAVQGAVAVAHSTNEATQREGRVLAGVHTRVVEVAHVHLRRGRPQCVTTRTTWGWTTGVVCPRTTVPSHATAAPVTRADRRSTTPPRPGRVWTCTPRGSLSSREFGPSFHRFPHPPRKFPPPHCPLRPKPPLPQSTCMYYRLAQHRFEPSRGWCSASHAVRAPASLQRRAQDHPAANNETAGRLCWGWCAPHGVASPPRRSSSLGHPLGVWPRPKTEAWG